MGEDEPFPVRRAVSRQARIRDGGLYFGHKDPAGTFTQWDAGTWEMAGSNQIKLSTANDAVISYEWSLSGDLLTFKDAEGCEFQYRKRS